MNTERQVPPAQEIFIHRDLSWLQFNDRVLAEARQKSNPLLERLKFLAISASNLDEFFMIRLASLNRSVSNLSRQGKHAQAKQLQSVRTKIIKVVNELISRQSKVLNELTEELHPHGIKLIRREPKDSEAYAQGKAIFDRSILAEMGQPSKLNLGSLRGLGSLQMAVIFPNGEVCAVPKQLPQVYCEKGRHEGEVLVFFLDDLLAAHLGHALELQGEPGIIRLTRDGDVTVDIEEEDTESIPDAIRSGIVTRDKGRPVRLQYAGHLADTLLKQCASLLRLDTGQVLHAPQLLSLHALWSAVNQMPEALRQNPVLGYPSVKPSVPKPFLSKRNIFEILRERDLLLHHPYDSFDAFVSWITRACEDPQVKSIELTVYRTDAVSPVISALKAAAGSKRIRVIIELRARFDELNNLRLAEELRQAGVEIAFGFGKLKLHAKIALVTRIEEGTERHYTHVSTGNYNAVTARIYTDLAILTAHPDIGADARLFFDSVWKGEIPSSFKALVSAPTKLHRRLIHHIEVETKAAIEGKKARIVAKVNALVDESMIKSLYRASRAGVQIDLIVRGACSLLPGVKGLSENIRVISVVDRYLEHSRLYFFESTRTMYLSSADWMPRNFFSRLEIAYPVLDDRIYRFIAEVVIPTYLADNVKAKELTAGGQWRVRTAGGELAPKIRSQIYFEDLAQKGYGGTPLE